MTAPALPEDVERALQAAASAQVAFGIDVSAENATTTINAWQALRAAIAAHVAPPVSASFEESLTGLDVEAVERRDNGVTVHDNVELDSPVKKVTTKDGAVYEAHSIIVAPGAGAAPGLNDRP